MKVALLQGADCSRREVMDRLGITEVEAKAAEARLARVRDDLVLGLDDERPIFRVT